MTKQSTAVGTVALIAAFATLTLPVPAHAGRMLDLVAKPAQSDPVSVARGNSSPRAIVPSWHTEAITNQTLFAPERSGRLFGLVVMPAQAHAASISRGNDSPFATDSTSSTGAVAQSRTGVVKSGEFVQRDARCEVRDVCSSGAVGAVATPYGPSLQAQGEALTTIR